MNVSGQFPRYTASIAAPHAGGLSLLQVRDFVTRQWRLVALVTALAIIVGIAYLALTPRKYTAQADMIIDTKRVSFSQSELATENRIVEDASVEPVTRSADIVDVAQPKFELVRKLAEHPLDVEDGLGMMLFPELVRDDAPVRPDRTTQRDREGARPRPGLQDPRARVYVRVRDDRAEVLRVDHLSAALHLQGVVREPWAEGGDDHTGRGLKPGVVLRAGCVSSSSFPGRSYTLG